MPHVRRELAAKTKDAAWERCGGPDAPRCEGTGCGLPIVGTPVYDHILPDWLGGEPTLENCQVLGKCCDPRKTAGDQKQIAKTKRQRRADAGIKSEKRGGFQTNRDSSIKMTILHGPVDRRTGEPIGRKRG